MTREERRRNKGERRDKIETKAIIGRRRKKEVVTYKIENGVEKREVGRKKWEHKR